MEWFRKTEPVKVVYTELKTETESSGGGGGFARENHLRRHYFQWSLATLPDQIRLKTIRAHCELPSVVSPRIGTAQEVVNASLGYEQSKLISSHSTMASIQHVRVRLIVPPGGVSWKQSCSLTGAPLHDDDA